MISRGSFLQFCGQHLLCEDVYIAIRMNSSMWAFSVGQSLLHWSPISCGVTPVIAVPPTQPVPVLGRMIMLQAGLGAKAPLCPGVWEPGVVKSPKFLLTWFSKNPWFDARSISSAFLGFQSLHAHVDWSCPTQITGKTIENYSVQ